MRQIKKQNARFRDTDSCIEIEVITISERYPCNCPQCQKPLERGRDLVNPKEPKQKGRNVRYLFELTCAYCKTLDLPYQFWSDGVQHLYRTLEDAAVDAVYLTYPQTRRKA